MTNRRHYQKLYQKQGNAVQFARDAIELCLRAKAPSRKLDAGRFTEIIIEGLKAGLPAQEVAPILGRKDLYGEDLAVWMLLDVPDRFDEVWRAAAVHLDSSNRDLVNDLVHRLRHFVTSDDDVIARALINLLEPTHPATAEIISQIERRLAPHDGNKNNEQT